MAYGPDSGGRNSKKGLASRQKKYKDPEKKPVGILDPIVDPIVRGVKAHFSPNPELDQKQADLIYKAQGAEAANKYLEQRQPGVKAATTEAPSGGEIEALRKQQAAKNTFLDEQGVTAGVRSRAAIPEKERRAAIQMGTIVSSNEPTGSYETVSSHSAAPGLRGIGAQQVFKPDGGSTQKFTQTGYQNLGTYGGPEGSNIYGKSSKPGGPMDTFTGAGTPVADTTTVNGDLGPYGIQYNPNDPYAGSRDAVLHARAERSRAGRANIEARNNRAASARGRREFGGGAAVGDSTLRSIRRSFQDAHRRNQRGMGAKADRNAADLAIAEQTALNNYRGQGVRMRGQDILADTSRYNADTSADAGILRSQMSQEGANQRLGAQLGYKQGADATDAYRRNAFITGVDKDGKPYSFEDIAGLNEVSDMFGGEQATMQLLQSGGVSQGLLNGLVKLRSNLNNSEAFQEALTSVRDIPGFEGDRARMGDFFNNGIGALDILLGREVLRSDGNPAIIAEDAFKGTGLTKEDISALVQQLKQGN